MAHDDLNDLLALELAPGFQFTDDQASVMEAYHEGTGRVCVGSGAGTGKTTTLTRVVAEAVVRLAQPNPQEIERNPFDEILVTTFGRDAAGQLKTKTKQLLREHETHCGTEFDPAVWRWIETDSNISTIDSFVGDLLREIATEVSVAPNFEVRDDLETEDLLREIVRSIENTPQVAEALDVLDNELEDKSPRRYLYDIHQKLREFCYEFPAPDADPGTTMFTDQMVNQIHAGRTPPFEAADIREIVSTVAGVPQREVTVPDEETRRRIEKDYQQSIAFTEAVDDLIDVFNAEYDKRTRASGQLSYQDITYLVWQYLESDAGDELSRSLADRYSHVFIDEFQDTSYAQCQILSRLINNEAPRTSVLVIGDIKQSIYGWRTADPEIFARILGHADEETDDPDPYLRATDWTRTELVTNFRSHPHLVRAGNHLFDQIFNNPGMGAIGTFPVDWGPLRPHRPNTNPETPHFHILPLGDVSADQWRTKDPQQVAAAIRDMVDDESVTIGSSDDERCVRPGDVTILFRRGTYMEEFQDALENYGLQSAVLAEKGLFKTEEVGFLIDVLDWFANPHSKDSLLRILRSPVTALTDKTLRFITSQNLNLGRAVDTWPVDELPESDKRRLEGLIDLRSDLRWDREGAKAALIQKIIQHTGLETIMLTGDDALQRYGNLWMLVELAKEWEDEELLPYREFVSRLKRYQEMAQANNESFEVAQTADRSSDDTVKLRTVHSSKGLEFPVVVLADLLAGPGGRVQSRSTVAYRDPDSGNRRYALRPRPAGEPIDYPDGPGGKWIRDNYRSTLWLAPERDAAGRFRYPHPYNPALQDDFAEFWRLLYVAFTRAGDHLVVSLGDSSHSSHKWSSWAHPLLDTFQETDSWDRSEDGATSHFQLTRSAMHPTDDGQTEIPLDIGRLGDVEPMNATPMGLPTATETEPEHIETGWDGMPFSPRELNPSTLHDLIACPKRYQYRALQNVSEARGESPPGSNNPEGYSASYWGTLVHEALEALHSDLPTGDRSTEDGVLAKQFEQHSDITEELSSILETYKATDIWTRVQEATTVLPEYEVSAIHSTTPQVHVSGVIDLLFETDDGWEIVDFKTGREPDDGTYLARQYESQLATYAWLLKEAYNIEARHTWVIYVEVGGSHDADVDWTEFTSYLEDLPQQLTVETEIGLSTNPSPDPESTSLQDLDLQTRCGSCPYTSICPAWE